MGSVEKISGTVVEKKSCGCFFYPLDKTKNLVYYLTIALIHEVEGGRR